MLWKKKRPWLFTRKGTNSDTVTQSSPLPSDIISSKWYQDIIDLPLSKFIAVDVEGDIFALVISGAPDITDLMKAWQRITWQFSDAVKNEEYAVFLRLKKEVLDLELEFKRADILIDCLQTLFCEKMKKALNKLLRSSFKFDIQDPAGYEKDLDSARMRMKNTKILLELKRGALEVMELANQKGAAKKVTRQYYQQMLISLSDFAGYAISDEITVFQYCDRLRRMNDHFEALNANNNARRGSDNRVRRS